MRLRGFEQICSLLPVSGDPAFSTVGWQVVANQRKDLRYTYTYIPPQVKSIHTVYLAQSFSRDALAGTLQGTLMKQCVVICTPVLLQEWALEHDLPKDKLERPMTRNQIKEHSKRVPPLGQRKRIHRATRITQAEELVDDSVATDGNEEIATSTVLKQDVQGSLAGQENRAQAHEVRKVHKSANETAAERIRASLAIARVQSTGQQVSNAGDALQPTEKKELRQLLSSYRDRIVALEDAALKDAAIKEGLQTGCRASKKRSRHTWQRRCKRRNRSLNRSRQSCKNSCRSRQPGPMRCRLRSTALKHQRQPLSTHSQQPLESFHNCTFF